MNFYIVEFRVKFLLKTDTKFANHHTRPAWRWLFTGQSGERFFHSLSAALVSSNPWLWICLEKVTSNQICSLRRALSSGRMLDAVTWGHPIGLPFCLLPIRLSRASEKSDSTLWQMKMSSWKFSALVWFWAKHKGFSS